MPLLIFMIGTCFGSFISCMAHRYITHNQYLEEVIVIIVAIHYMY